MIDYTGPDYTTPKKSLKLQLLRKKILKKNCYCQLKAGLATQGRFRRALSLKKNLSFLKPIFWAVLLRQCIPTNDLGTTCTVE